ncbi:MAG: hypothetical protein BV459_02560 [Thermoplasmata archaeon M11B2D]|nr:MAG: hypothetical protein BV459_02560 [Thermoplasmata archaeon M11B2D]PNX52973.1 MAG: hypothetical protein BV458_06835 [Thermoplasmata archaeon M9B2D]
MKKYIGVALATIALISMGSASAVLLQISEIKTSPLTTGTLDCGGGCGGGGCHNNTNMTEITGVLQYNNTVFKIGTTTLNFGCYDYLNSTTSPYDFDGDGEIETILNELLGLVGTTITVEGYTRCQNRFIVFYINGIEYRDCTAIESLA